MGNYEELLLLYIDGELDEAEAEELLAFIAQHPALAKELKEYEQLRLMPDMSMGFDDKDKLLKKEPSKLLLTGWLKYGIAAALVLLIGFTTIKWLIPDEQKQTEPPIIAVQQNKSIHKIPTDTSNKSEPVLATFTPKKTAPKNPILTKPEKKKTNEPTYEKTETIAAIPEIKSTTTLPMQNSFEQLATTPLTHEKISKIQAENTPKQRINLLAWLPINKEKKAGLEGLRNNLETKIIKTKTIVNTINKTDFVVKFGGKEVIVVNF